MANIKDKISSSVIGDALREAGHKIDDLSEEAAKKSDKIIHHGQKAAEQYGDEAIRYIKNSPLKSVLIALGIGLILGRFLK